MLSLYKNLIALERACGKDTSSIRTCQRLLKASPREIDIWLCLAALHEIGGSDGSVASVYKNALGSLGGHAEIAYCAAKHFIRAVHNYFIVPPSFFLSISLFLSLSLFPSLSFISLSLSLCLSFLSLFLSLSHSL